MNYFDTLYTASYNGASFVVQRTNDRFGRRIAQHLYPFRDTFWPEDVGKRPREFELDGFILGDDALAQLAFLQAACEIKGTGVLIHPLYGIQVVQLLEYTSQGGDHGRQVRVHFKFVEAGGRIFPTTSATSGTANAASGLSTASVASFLTTAGNAISSGLQVAIQAAITAATLVAVAQAAVKTATNIVSEVSSIGGNTGRNAAGSTGVSTGSITGTIASAGGVAAQASQVATLLGAGAQNQSIATASSLNLKSIASSL